MFSLKTNNNKRCDYLDSFFSLLKDRSNNKTLNTTAGDGEFDAELGDFQLPISLSARASTVSHNIVSTNAILQQRSSIGSANNPATSIQHNVVLHSNVNEPLLPANDRLDLNLPSEHNPHHPLSRKANSLMTVYEHTTANDHNLPESSTHSDTWRARSPSSVGDLTYQRASNNNNNNNSMPEQITDQNEKVSKGQRVRFHVSFPSRYDSDL